MATDLYLGLDFGGTSTKLGVFSVNGGIRGRSVVLTDPSKGPEDTLRRVGDAVHALMQTTGQALACGIGVPGRLDPERTRLLRAVNLPGWTDVPLIDILRQRLGLPAFLENDANCAAWGEYRAGIGCDVTSLVLYTLGTGVGAGLVLQGNLWTGVNGGAGRLGHMSLNPEGPPCGCGQRGCLEQYSSASAIQREYGRGTAKEAFEAARRGEPHAIAVIDVACDALAASMALVIQTIQPELVVLGGGMAAAGDTLLNGVRAGLKRRADALWLDQVRVELSVLGGDAGWIGAALWARHQMCLERDS